EQRHQDRPAERLVLPDPLARVRPREDPRSRLVLERRERIVRIVSAAKSLGAHLDEGGDERAVLVERRSIRPAVLFQRDGDLGALLELEAEIEEGAQAEGAKRAEERRRAGDRGVHGNASYAAAPALPP